MTKFLRVTILTSLSTFGLGLMATSSIADTGYYDYDDADYYSEPGYVYADTQPTITLVYIEPGVWIIENYDEPVFFYDNYYWTYYNNYWYRSSYYYGGWVRVRPPRLFHRIHHPRSYIHYRAPARTHRRTITRVRDHRRQRVDYDHRRSQPRSSARVPATRGPSAATQRRPRANTPSRRTAPNRVSRPQASRSRPQASRSRPQASRSRPQASRSHRVSSPARSRGPASRGHRRR